MSLEQYAETHTVTNQPTPLDGSNLYRGDRPLQEWLQRFGAGWGEARLAEYGELAGGPLLAAGFAANRQPPELHSHDRFGYRIDQVEFHPAWHRLLQAGISHGLHALPWREPRPGAQALRAGLFYLHNQAEAGSACPLTMTCAGVAVLRRQPELAEAWLPGILSLDYDPRPLPAGEKRGLTLGMALTEKQGGTDLRANSTRAFALGAPGPGQAYELLGHKWFCSAPMSDAFLTLAYSEQGLSCFLLPRLRPDGSHNRIYIQRLKDKQGNRSNASAELEYRGALAWMVGEEGRGIATILEMVALTRFDCMTGSAALMRQALSQALHHCAQRQVGGRVLEAQPLMQNVLADLALDSEAALALSLRLGHALERPEDEQERHFARLLTAVGKYWVCKRAPAFIGEAQECLGGAGYVEESILPRLYREAPVNSIWEGSGNVQCLDVLRTLEKVPAVAEALFAELGDGHGDARLKAQVLRLKLALQDREGLEYRARQLCGEIAVALQASLLLQGAPQVVSDAFIAARVDASAPVYGCLPRGVEVAALLARSRLQAFD
ncbi:putative acyl-CoA dehydrogenase [Geopseudomonas sagittaria]|uniref:Putative acyl-CoA dehydrogenase n=1 Tax=Geopseudomonas sagittaria TaxID=1135990 RepID=A0A1I5P4D3_9GAMM|nr:acyl-CoA dehydrogenase family protein [Pseudomonas sagittaria]MCM2330225.1 acyl-CoA dehydrogenase family protein [Pseudomonas sagittaria]SFP28954.1 putative acyl-CoA dehydrogenase [Pseudomonas sagittaria]